MDTLDAAVRQIEGKYFMVILSGEDEIRIPLCEDKPVEVKGAFNKLILRIKQGPVQLRLTESGEDLFSQVAVEYLKQLNREVREVRTEMVQHGLAAE